jgi:hypothetical protein
MTKLQATLQAHLKRLGACEDAREWAKDKTPLQAWKQCARPDWLMWWAARTPVNEKSAIVVAACGCARITLPPVSISGQLPFRAIEAALAWVYRPTEYNRLHAEHRAFAVAGIAQLYAKQDAYSATASAAYAASWAAYSAAYSTFDESMAWAAVQAVRYAASAIAQATSTAGAAPVFAPENTALCTEIRKMLQCPFSRQPNPHGL